MYKDPTAYREVNATIYSGYYEDERVLLKDLLFPDNSKLYQANSFKIFKSAVGAFKKKFIEELSKGDYPSLKQAIPSQTLNNMLTMPVSASDTASEIFSNSSGISIYFPYSENFGTSFTAAYFDNINTDPFGSMATVIPTDRTADSAPGNEPYRKKTYGTNGEIIWMIEYKPVTVNDDYAELKPTHIVGAGVETLRPAQDPPQTLPNISRVFVGWTRINNKRQYDRLISLTGNGGGSEIKICRVSGYLQFLNQQVTSFAGDQIDVRFRRREINRGTWKKVYSVWDADWVAANTEQVMTIYEDDTEGTKTFNGSLSTTVTITTGTTATGTIGYNVSIKTQDELILQTKYTRTAYFGAAKADQGCGFQMCDTKGGTCRYDNTFLTLVNWPIYNCGANWNYTWSYNLY